MRIIIAFQKFHCEIEKQNIAKVTKKEMRILFSETFQECESWIRCEPCLYFWSIAQYRKTTNF